MKIRLLVLLAFLSMALVACGSQDDTGDDNDNADTNSTSLDYSYSVTVNDDVTFTQDDAPVKNTIIQAPMIEVDSRTSTQYFMRIEFDSSEITAPGNYEIDRVTLSFPSDLGESGTVGCGSNDGTPDDVMMTVTAVDGNRLSGTLTVALTSCDDYVSGEAVEMESASVVAEFTDIPFLPDSE